MTADQWREVKEVLNACLELEPAKRLEYLDEACKGKPEMRQEVESLLASYDEAGDFIERPALEDTSRGRRIGPYEILEEIGAGGMGRIYRSKRVDEQFEQQVAIKLVKRGMDSEFILRQFRNERQILADLDHPNIARLLDGGMTSDGVPYFVMEYIEGEPVDRYCESHNLATSERLELFRQICAAVQYAHQRLVVHRDIKPGNILVTRERVPKLLDFGIAKILSDDRAHTVTAARLMTPDYASPEQIRGEPITTAADIYSLGVLLYQLLTNRQPYQTTSRAVHEIAQVVCENDPPPPSTFAESNRRAIEGDLDNIVLKAMRKEPTRRYPSVEQLSEDIRRHLAGLPVSARKDTLHYRASKFIRRNKVAVAAGVTVLVSLTGGLAATAWQASVAHSERIRAERRFNDVRKLANAVVFELHDAIRDLPGSTPARLLLVKRAIEYLDSLARESADDRSLKRELAAAYTRVGDVQGFGSQANLGDTAGARASYEKARAILEALVAADPSNVEDQLSLTSNYTRAGGQEYNRKALAIVEELAKRHPGNRKVKWALGSCYDAMGNDVRQSADWAAALEWRRKQFQVFRELYEEQPDSDPTKRNYALAAKKLGASLVKTGAAAEALKNYQLAVTIEEQVAAADPNNAHTRMGLSFSYSDTGFVLLELKRPEEAVDYYRKATAIREELYQLDPKNKRAQTSLASVYWRLAAALRSAGKPQDGLEFAKKSVATLAPAGTALPAGQQEREEIAETYFRLSEAYDASGNRADARVWLQRAKDILVELKRQNRLSGLAAEYLPQIDKRLESNPPTR